MVSDQHLASDVGVDILRQGGNAVDAAVAVGFAQAVVNPCCGNIGGGGFMLVHLAGGKDVFLDFREKAPGKAGPAIFQDGQGRPPVRAGLHGQQRREVARRAGHGAVHGELAGEDIHAVFRNAAIGRPQAVEVVEGRRVAQRAAGIGTDAGHAQSGGYRHRRSRGGSAGNTRHFRIGRIGRRAVMRIQPDTGKCEFRHVGLADNRRTCNAQALDDRRIRGCRRTSLEHGGTRKRGFAGDVDQILDRHGQSCQRRDLHAGGAHGIGMLSGGTCSLGIEPGENGGIFLRLFDADFDEGAARVAIQRRNRFGSEGVHAKIGDEFRRKQ